MAVTVYQPANQAVGEFDGGKITELKPIGFPGEGSAVKGIGPLFYWSWAYAKQEGYIPMHPHQAFEIITYMVNGQAEHADTLGTRSVVQAGGAQVMQTGSGVSHSERFIGPDSEGFQIWFEPHIREALQRKPTYNQYEHAAFPVISLEGVSVKTIIGPGAPVELVADANMFDVEIPGGKHHGYSLAAGRVLAALAIRGGGEWSEDCGRANGTTPFRHKDFTVIEAPDTVGMDVVLSSTEGARIILIDVPAHVDYPLYQKSR
ncbi:pirin family protein [Paenibacillus xerothermodurans]|uniref:Pirin n=1 Tax=Paenibacillus xerothermodurans TaxID=1977292 RepID=A0A2W1P2B2_PAEXE|nr:pirin family protein [Paenibacillus xerothermodurans]PZE21278.1 pirin [Paenibacillus xerothermodurans]